VQVCGKQGVADEIIRASSNGGVWRRGVSEEKTQADIPAQQFASKGFNSSRLISLCGLGPVTRKKKMQNLGKARVKAIPSTEPAARDEGPRLIPLRIEEKEGVPMSHYLLLADKALGTAARPAKIKKQDGAEAEDEKKSE
jgi:hypothetical protein